MRTRSTNASKSPATAAAARKQATPSSADEKVEYSPTETTTPKIVEPKRASAGRGKQVSVTPDSEPQELGLAKKFGQGSAAVNLVSRTKIVKKVVKKVIRKTPVSTRAASVQTTESGVLEKAKTEETTREKTLEDLNNAEAGNDESATDDSRLVENVEPSVVENESVTNPGNSSNKEGGEAGEPEKRLIESVERFSEAIEPVAIEMKSVENQEPCRTNKKEELKEEKEEQLKITDKENPKDKTGGMEEDTGNQVKQLYACLEQPDDEKIEGLSDQEVHEEFSGEDFVDDDSQENKGEAETFEEERMQLNAAARECKVKRKREIFVGGLGRDASERDIRKVFEYAGEVVAVRMHVDPSTKKNMGYAFVQFATKEQATHALSEMKNPVIHGKRCGTAPSEDNDTLFLGNICNTWTKDAIKQKLKDYGVEGVENITLVADPRYKGLSRGFAFVEFSSNVEAMLAYKRLQKPDVVFGHSARTAKVAFAEPLREPDPEVMARVKSVFIDGLPPHWDEDSVREKLKAFGEIVRIMLARNMSTAKRKDFGFVHFKTHEAAVSCVEVVNSNGLNDGNSKIKVRARLSNPLPKMQAIKGGMCGGFHISHGSSGWGFGQDGHSFNQENFRYGHGSYPHGPGHGGRMGFSSEHELDDPYPPVHGRSNFRRGGRWGFRGAHQGTLPVRPYPDRVRHGATYRGYGDYDLYRMYAYSYEEGYDRSFTGRHFDEPYPYDNVAYRIKRPYYMRDQDPEFAEPSRHRPRLDPSDLAASFHGARYRDDLGADGGSYRQNYYGSDYGAGSYSLFYWDDHTYGRGYYH